MANENEGVQTTATTTEQTKYLDKKGLETFWGKVKALVTAAVATLTDSIPGIVKPITDPIDDKITEHINNKSNPHGVTKKQLDLENVTNDAQVKRSEMGKANGVATLDSNGRVPLAQLGNLDTSLYIIPSDNKLPTTGIKTNKIYLIKETSGTNNVYTEYIYVNSAWEKLGQFKADVDLTPYAKTTYVEGELNKFPREQLKAIKNAKGNLLYMDVHPIDVDKNDNDEVTLSMTYANDNGTTESDTVSLPKASATQPGTMSAADFTKLAGIATGATKVLVDSALSSTSTNPLQNKAVYSELGKKLPLSGGTISGNLAVTGTLTKGGKDVLTDHQAIYSLTITHNGTNKGTFNPKKADASIAITTPTKLSGFTDDVVKGKYLPLTGGGKVVGTGDSTFYTDITNGAITVGDSDTDGDSILINRGGFTKQRNGNTIGSATQAFATNGTTINMSNYATTDAMNTELKKYLPLTGGTLTGQVSSPSFIAGSSSAPSVIANSSGLTATTVNAAKIVNTNHAQAKYLLCGDGTVAERIEETEIAAICV